MCVCVSIYIYICVHIYIYIHIYNFVHIDSKFSSKWTFENVFIVSHASEALLAVLMAGFLKSLCSGDPL